MLYPVLSFLIRKSFRINSSRYQKAVEHIDAQLADVEKKLADGRQSILGGDALNYTDLAFAAIMGLWLQPAGYGGGKADAVRIEREQCPPAMIRQIEKWSTAYPLCTRLIDQAYQDRGNS